MSVLLSIKPEFADLIFAGEKRFEFRRVLPVREVDRVVVYSSSPIQRIIGEFSVRRVLSTSPVGLWRKTRKHAGITRSYFDEYFRGRDVAHALEVEVAVRYPEPVDPRVALDSFHPPQSFVYLQTLQSRGLTLPAAA